MIGVFLFLTSFLETSQKQKAMNINKMSDDEILNLIPCIFGVAGAGIPNPTKSRFQKMSSNEKIVFIRQLFEASQ